MVFKRLSTRRAAGGVVSSWAFLTSVELRSLVHNVVEISLSADRM